MLEIKIIEGLKLLLGTGLLGADHWGVQLRLSEEQDH